MKLLWRTEKRKPIELVEMLGNPRKINEQQKGNLDKSLTKFGLAEIPVIDADNTIIAGHQRIKALIAKGAGKMNIDVRVPNRKLTERERKRYNILSNHDYGVWDDEKLINFFDAKELLEWGFSEAEIPKHEVSRDNNPIKQQLQVYVDGETKKIVLYYDVEQYEDRVDRMLKIMNNESLKNSKEVLLFLINHNESN